MLLSGFVSLFIMFAQADDSTVVATPPATVVEAQTSESAIPVKLEVKNKDQDAAAGGTKVLFSIAVLGILLTGGYFGIRKYKNMNLNQRSDLKMQILTQYHLGPKKSLAVVRVAGESILIGVTDHSINLIKSLSLLDEDIPTEVPNQFQAALDKADSEDEFSITGIQSIVSQKLKSMRSIQ